MYLKAKATEIAKKITVFKPRFIFLRELNFQNKNQTLFKRFFFLQIKLNKENLLKREVVLRTDNL